ncbi:MAG: BBP7 family outer membrane beta-barrel protein [Planctomycetales bacterium]|nr:BBP7 family outer membrane beta-barrel protein [Planctomycetales bacterium]
MNSIGRLCKSKLGSNGGLWIALLALVACLGQTTDLHAQLRNGSNTRSLYQQRPDQMIPAGQASAVRNSRSGVSRASYVQEEPGSILEMNEAVPAPEPIPNDVSNSPVGPETTPGSMMSPEVTYGHPQSMGTYYGSGLPNCGGCGQIGCLGCGGLISWLIAPRNMCCSAGCDSTYSIGCGVPLGCGPLAALWYRTKIRAEVPLFWRRGAAPPALVSTAVGGGTGQTLLGDRVLNEDSQAGFRITAGTYFGEGDCFHLLFRYWTAGDQDDNYRFDSSQFTSLSRPFNQTDTGTPVANTYDVVVPNLREGFINVATTSRVDGVDVILRRKLYQDRFSRLDWLWGYQHVGVDESLTITDQSTFTAASGVFVPGDSIATRDHFETSNNFHGVSYGLMNSRSIAAWKLETMFRLGLGNLRRITQAAGETTTTSGVSPFTSSTEQQGLLARDTNSRRFQDDTFVVVPNVGINLACCLRPGLDFTFGYEYMLLPKVAQASQQIDDSLRVNLSDPFSGSLDPAFSFDERRYWIHSLGLGLQLRY